MTVSGCPSDDQLTAYLQGRVSPAEAESLEAHLADCANCEAKIKAADGLGRILAEAYRQGPIEEDHLASESEFHRAVKAIQQPRAGQRADDAEAPAPDEMTRDYVESAPRIGQVIAGRYKLLERIGEGGMGTVFMAEQTEPVRRLVAVKVVQAGMDSRAVLARFEAERQALAMMDHPNIARVLDVGCTESGRPFFVMELIKGTPITKYCDQRKLTLRERLELFVPVCQAIQHAHQKGVIHRDVKPSNVLVALYDDRAVPKVIDFGLAKALGQRLTDKTVYTEFGRVVGTIRYMSPEQATLNNLDIDTRSDVYSLGALLYELLTGTTPVDRKSLDNAAILEQLRMVREVDVPRPSTRLSSSAALPSIAANRNTEPAKLAGLMRGELDWVLLKALEKDRARRYETANGLARDIQRYLADEVVEARPPSAGYRLRKFVRRHKLQVTAAGLVLLALMAGIAGTTYGLFRADQQRRRADDNAGEARQQATNAATERDRAREALSGEKEARQAADAAKRQMQRQLALSYMDRGVNELERGDPLQGYAILGQAYHAASEEPDLRASALALLGAWNFELPGVLRHDGAVFAVAFSPDGTKIATASLDKTARLWEAATGRPLSAIKHDGAVVRVSFSPDGTKIATASRDHTVRLWDAATCKALGEPMRNAEGAFAALSFSPDGTKIATAGYDRTARLWDATTGKPLGPPMEHDDIVREVAFSPDGTKIATRGSDGKARLWDGNTCKPLGTAMKHDRGVSALAFSPDGTKLATGGLDHTARLWDAATGKPLGTPMKHGDFVNAVAFSPDGTKLATGTGDNKAILWDVATCKLLVAPMEHDDWLTAVVFSPDGTKLATAGLDHNALVWDATTGKLWSTPIKHVARVNAVAFSPDGTRIVTASVDGTARLWDWAAGKPLGPRMNHEYSVYAVAFSPDGTKIATAGWDRIARLWDASTGKRLGPPMKHDRKFVASRVGSVAFSPDGTKLATADWDRTARLWDATTCKPLGPPMEHDDIVRAVAFSPDGTKIATACEDGKARLWDATTYKPLGAPLMLGSLVASIAFSPDGKKIATGSADRLARLWDVATGKPLGVPIEHDASVLGVAFSPDGTKIATACDDHTARVWDAATGKPLGAPLRHGHAVEAVSFSPDGTKLATASRDRTARLWDVATGQALGGPMKHEDVVAGVSFSPDGTKIATASHDGTARIWHVPRSLRDDPAWIAAYAQIASGWKESADGTLLPVSSGEATANYAEIVKSSPLFEYRSATLEESRRALHEGEAARWEAEGNWFAAAFHLRWLAKHDSDAGKWQKRLQAVDAARAMVEGNRDRAAPLPEREFLPSLAKRLPAARRVCSASERCGVSPDGSKIARLVQSLPGQLDLQIIDASTGTSRLLVDDAHDPAWQPRDGRWIAFERRKGAPEIWLVPTDGGAAKKLCDGQYPAWSADGKTVYCFSQAARAVVAVDVATSRQTRLVETDHWYPAISSDGKRLAHLKHGQLAIDDIASGKTLRTCPLPGWNGLFAGWSPDGNQVAFGSRGYTNRDGLWLLDVETGRKTLIAAGPWTMPVWSSDGSKFTFQYRGPGEWSIWIVDAKELAKLMPEPEGN